MTAGAVCGRCGFHARGCSCSTGCKAVAKLEALGLAALPPGAVKLPEGLGDPALIAGPLPLVVHVPRLEIAVERRQETRAEYYARRARGER